MKTANKLVKSLVVCIQVIIALGLQACNLKPTNADCLPYDVEQNQLQGGKPQQVEETTTYMASKPQYKKQHTLYTYNTNGHLLSTKAIRGNDTTMVNCIHYMDNDIVERLEMPNTGNYSNKYTPDGDLQEESYTRKDKNNASVKREYTYYKGHLQICRTTENGEQVSRDEYEFEDKKLVSSIHWTPGAEITKQTNEYDEKGRTTYSKYYSYNKLVKEERCAYKEDAQGNWTRKKLYTRNSGENRYILTEQTERKIAYYSPEALVKAPIIQMELTDQQGKTHYSWMFWVFIVVWVIAYILFLLIAANSGMLKNFSGNATALGKGKTGTPKMTRVWMYNQRPYTRVMLIAALLAAAFAATVLLFILLGLLAWGGAWLCKFVAMGLVYAGYVLIGLAAVGLITLQFRFALIAGAAGALLVVFNNTMRLLANNAVSWGTDFKEKMNIFRWALTAFADNWQYLVVIIVAPMVLFLALALVLMIVSLVLRLFEGMVMAIYNLKHVCPTCGNKKNLGYLTKGRKGRNGHFLSQTDRLHPVALRPSIYGIFYHRHPITGEKMPTMLLNGKGKIARYCDECKKEFNSKTQETTGTPVHVAIAGVRSSGKSSLLYTGLKQLKDLYGSAFQQVDDENNDIEAMYERVKNGDGIQTALKDMYKAIQVQLQPKGRTYPYHLFFYDVAGEKYDASSRSSNTGMDTYRNVKTIMFVIDPTTIDTEHSNSSARFSNWQKKHNYDGEAYDVEATFSLMMTILETNGRTSGGKAKDVELMFVLNKTDLGYLNATCVNNPKDGKQLKSFVTHELGLHNMASQADQLFGKVSYKAVSIYNKEDMTQLFKEALNKAGADL